MPQMSPMPWMIILSFSILMFVFINTYIYFTSNKINKINSSFKLLNYKIKW